MGMEVGRPTGVKVPEIAQGLWSFHSKQSLVVALQIELPQCTCAYKAHFGVIGADDAV